MPIMHARLSDTRRISLHGNAVGPAGPLRARTLVPLVIALALTGCASATAPDAPVGPALATAAPPPQQVSAAQPPRTAQPSRIDEFPAWRAAFSSQALAAGIRPATVREVLGSAQRLPRVVELDQSQPEFTRPPWAYLDSAASPQRIAQGRAKLAEQRTALGAAEARYGVPASTITAIWGLESNFGQNFGSFRAVDALATLAFDGRRRAWAEGELLAALRIADQDHIPADRMVGSWAGAMGHTQFMPTVFLAHAVDADGDGQRDIWGSIPDVAASTANFLARSGWRSGEPGVPRCSCRQILTTPARNSACDSPLPNGLPRAFSAWALTSRRCHRWRKLPSWHRPARAGRPFSWGTTSVPCCATTMRGTTP